MKTEQLGGDARFSALPPSNDPYRTADSPHLLEKKPPRRTLDDMRRLSEEIKRARELKGSRA
jgi:hypothetical protein